MKLNFIGATHEVTGSCTYIEACGKRFLVDFGMEQGVDYFENAKIPCPPGNIDFVLLTHAHMIIQVCFHCWRQAALLDRYTQRRPLVIYVR